MIKQIYLFITCLLFMSNIWGQSIPTAQLPPPGQFSLNYLRSLGQNNILWGSEPPNYNGETILFNHGYIGSTESLLFFNRMYEYAYNAGFKTAFVSTTRGRGPWVNGEILSRAIDQVSIHFKQDSLYIVAHSNGGKASEVAMFKHNKRDKIRRVITLGTPFRGTQLANIGQIWWFTWVWKLIGLNDDMAMSTTYYCDGVFRPYFDRNPLNQPKKFYSYGVWGWNRGHTLFKPLMIVGGGLIHLAGGGPNDGVTPFYSSTRPGSTMLSPLWAASGAYDHMDIMYGQYSWRYFSPYLLIGPNRNRSIVPAGLTNIISLSTENSEKKQEKSLVPAMQSKTYTENGVTVIEESSHHQVISSENEYQKIILDPQSSNTAVYVIKEDEKATLTMKNNIGTVVKTFKPSKDMNGDFNSHIEEFTVNNQSNFTIHTSSGKYAAFVYQENSVGLNYKYISDKQIEATLNNLPANSKTIEVNLVVEKTSDLLGNPVPEANKEPKVIALKPNANGIYTYSVSNLSPGVYAVNLSATDNTTFSRNVLSGFCVGTPEMIDKTNSESLKKAPISPEIVLSPNPVNTNTKLMLPVDWTKGTGLILTIYTVDGTVVKTFLQSQEKQLINQIGQKLAALPHGIYFMNIQNGSMTQTIKFIK